MEQPGDQETVVDRPEGQEAIVIDLVDRRKRCKARSVEYEAVIDLENKRTARG